MKNYQELTTSNGLQVIVSDFDFTAVSKWKWRVNKQGYAVRNSTKKQISIHQQVLGTKQGFEIDHINRNKLDNRRENLRYVTRSQNNFNRPVDPRNTTGHNGINKLKTGSYRVRLSGKDLGRYKTLEEAIAVRERYVKNAFLSTETNP